jgi:hypothetical protein
VGPDLTLLVLRVRYQGIADETERRNEYAWLKTLARSGHRQSAMTRLNRGAAQSLGKLLVSVQGRGPGREEDGGDDDESARREEHARRGARYEPQRGRAESDEEGEREAERVV